MMKENRTKPYREPIVWLVLAAYLLLSIGLTIYIDRFTQAGLTGTPRDLGISEAALFPFLLLELLAIVGGAALLTKVRTKGMGTGLIIAVPVAFLALIAITMYWGV